MKRDKRLLVAMTAEEYLRIKTKADGEGLSVATYMRTAALLLPPRRTEFAEAV